MKKYILLGQQGGASRFKFLTIDTLEVLQEYDGKSVGNFTFYVGHIINHQEAIDIDYMVVSIPYIKGNYLYRYDQEHHSFVQLDI